MFHFLQKCPDGSDEERKRLVEERAEDLTNEVLSKNRSRVASGSPRPPICHNKKTYSSRAPIAERFMKSMKFSQHSSCSITVSDGDISLNGTGRDDDGSDDNLVFPRLAKRALVKGIGKSTAISPNNIQVALTSERKAKCFTFSREWKIPRLTFHLSSGPLALLNMTF